MATLTDRAEIGCLVSSIGFRNPALLATMARTVDHISGGRLILGLGAGWFERDFHEYGYPFGSASQRLKTLEQALPIIKQRWQVDVPAPVRSPIPILIGGGGENITLRLAAQHANIWNSFGPADVYRRKSEVLDNWCKKVGRDASHIERSVLVMPEDLPRLDQFLAARATHIIVTLPEPWDVTIAEQLVRWRDVHR
jgi:probable F420-dependent oxidoreductase